MASATPSILARTARGAGWVMAGRLATRLLGLGSMLVLVRLLAPEDFGLVALATGFAFALDASLLIGVEDQIIRSREPDRALYDTAFTITVMRGLLVAVIVTVAAPYAGEFFGDARLTPVLFALALAMAGSGLMNIGTVDFRRHLDFHKEFRLLVLPRIIATVTTIATAAVTHSHWALVAGILTHRIIAVVVSYRMHPYRPRFSLVAWRELAGVSFWSWAIGMAVTLRDRSDAMVIGRIGGAAQVGIFAAGYELATVPTSELALAASRAVMPGLADLRRNADPAAERVALLRILGLMMLLTLPAGVGASLIAGPAVLLLLGARWLDAVPVVAIIALAAALSPLDTVGTGWLRARAALRSLLAAITAGGVLRLLLLLALIGPFGLTGAAMAVALATLAEPALIFAIAAHRLGIRPAELRDAMLRPLVAAGVMAAILAASGLGWAGVPADAVGALKVIALAVPLAVVSYVGTLLLMWRAAGAPEGAEADCLAALGRLLPALALSPTAPREGGRP